MRKPAYEHINDCWNDIRECKTREELETVLANLPRWSGSWYIDEEDGYLVVTNEYFDGQLDDYFSDSETLDIEAEAEE
ncbi:MAG: hypothetical protein II399_03850 [Lachnospiraceae bacterium]|nr:hypothetical protein [Lachnospiraceae bacterium]